MKNPDMKNENWERFMPHFKKQNIKRKKVKQEKKKERVHSVSPRATPKKGRYLDDDRRVFLVRKG